MKRKARLITALLLVFFIFSSCATKKDSGNKDRTDINTNTSKKEEEEKPKNANYVEAVQQEVVWINGNKDEKAVYFKYEAKLYKKPVTTGSKFKIFFENFSTVKRLNKNSLEEYAMELCVNHFVKLAGVKVGDYIEMFIFETDKGGWDNPRGKEKALIYFVGKYESPKEIKGEFFIRS